MGNAWLCSGSVLMVAMIMRMKLYAIPVAFGTLSGSFRAGEWVCDMDRLICLYGQVTNWAY